MDFRDWLRISIDVDLYVGYRFLTTHPEVFIYASLACLLLMIPFVKRLQRIQRDRMAELFGISGSILYVDVGLHGRKFVSRQYRIVAKPDYVIRMDSGDIAIIEYKSRDNSKVYQSDISQVKASVIAVRSRYRVTKAFVFSGKQLKEIDVGKSSSKLMKEIKEEYDYAVKAKRGEVCYTFTKNQFMCNGCKFRSMCAKHN